MIEREEALAILRANFAELETMGVESIALFGSVARGDARPDSDVDVLVDVRPGVGFFGLFRVQERLEALLGTRVDLVARDALKPYLRDRILAEGLAAA
ncbi:MAG TPA: nucleotidyltransferase domain-containing protein [Longimicrobiaceae bacterium]|jgi:predicted nucleotidyltransferase|nr:nucleotidyltransferase domain-containing protein [Longimicrobiaceae bacterium]